MTDVDISRERIERLKAMGSADYIHIALLDKIDRLTAERDILKNWQDHNANEVPRLKMQIEAMQEGRDQALARASAAAMEMRERAAEELDQWWKDDLPEDYPVPLIRALPIDHDAQKALDKLLAKAREDAIREAAALCAPKKAKVTRGNRITPSVTNPQSAAAQAARKQCQDSILALLNEGG